MVNSINTVPGKTVITRNGKKMTILTPKGSVSVVMFNDQISFNGKQFEFTEGTHDLRENKSCNRTISQFLKRLFSRKTKEEDNE